MTSTTSSSIRLLALGILSILIFSSCGKYEDGPGISLRSKEGRLVGQWDVDKRDGQSPTADIAYNYEFGEDGRLERKLVFVETQEIERLDGGWNFSDDKTEIEINLEWMETRDWTIKRLTNKELWYEDEFGVEWELVKQ